LGLVPFAAILTTCADAHFANGIEIPYSSNRNRNSVSE
jgi:hypothetical protein